MLVKSNTTVIQFQTALMACTQYICASASPALYRIAWSSLALRDTLQKIPISLYTRDSLTCPTLATFRGRPSYEAYQAHAQLPHQPVHRTASSSKLLEASEGSYEDLICTRLLKGALSTSCMSHPFCSIVTAHQHRDSVISSKDPIPCDIATFVFFSYCPVPSPTCY